MLLVLQLLMPIHYLLINHRPMKLILVENKLMLFLIVYYLLALISIVIILHLTMKATLELKLLRTLLATLSPHSWLRLYMEKKMANLLEINCTSDSGIVYFMIKQFQLLTAMNIQTKLVTLLLVSLFPILFGYQ